MRFSIWPALACCAFFHPAYAQDPTFTSTVTVGAGGNFVAGGYEALQNYSNAPTFLGDLEFRFYKYVAADLGIENALPIYTRYGGGEYFTQSRQVATLLPFGVRGILPVVKGRLEPYVGFGGAHVWHSEDQAYYLNLNVWLWQLNGGARLALDHNRHFWVGTTVRYYRDGLGTSHQQYISWTGDFSYRFGYRK